MNPFHVPETERGSTEPLCPWRVPTHHRWYVDVDDTRGAYDTFAKRMERVLGTSMLDERGLLVVVTGESGCGKTSLVHRCADLVDEATNRRAGAGFGPGDFIIDLTWYEYEPGAERSERTRLPEVCGQVLRRLRDGRPAPIGAALSELNPTQGHRRVYEELSREARRLGFTLLVLLPPVSDFTRELNEYLYLSRQYGRIVFFAESSDFAVEHFVNREDIRNLIVALKVNPMREGDMWMLINKRLGGCTGRVAQTSEREAALAEDWMRGFGAIPVRRVARTLHQAWQGRAPSDQLTAFDLVAPFSEFLTQRVSDNSSDRLSTRM